MSTLTESDTKTLAEFEQRILRRHDLIEEAAVAYLDIGRDLIAAKEAVGHGAFNKWCAERLPFKKRTAEKMMAAAAMVDEYFKSAPDAHLKPPQGVAYLLSASSTPDFVRSEYLEKIGNGESVTATAIRAAIRHHTSTPEAKPRARLSDAVVAETMLPEPELRPASHEAVDEVVAMMVRAMGYEAVCVANLLRQGLGEVLMDALYVATASLEPEGPEHVEPEEIADTEAETITLPWESETVAEEPGAVGVREDRAVSSQAPTLSPLVRSLLDDVRSLGGRQGTTLDLTGPSAAVIAATTQH